jgi:hypothetical protein
MMGMPTHVPGTRIPVSATGIPEARKRQQEWDERLPQWWDADGWAAYRTRMGLPQIESCDD